MCLVIQYMSLQSANESVVYVQYMYMLITICDLLYSTCHYNQLMKALYMYSKCTCVHAYVTCTHLYVQYMTLQPANVVI